MPSRREVVDNLLNVLTDTMHKYPSLRLGQLIINATGHERLYYLTDEFVIESLKKYLNRKDANDSSSDS